MDTKSHQLQCLACKRPFGAVVATADEFMRAQTSYANAVTAGMRLANQEMTDIARRWQYKHARLKAIAIIEAIAIAILIGVLCS